MKLSTWIIIILLIAGYFHFYKGIDVVDKTMSIYQEGSEMVSTGKIWYDRIKGIRPTAIYVIDDTFKFNTHTGQHPINTDITFLNMAGAAVTVKLDGYFETELQNGTSTTRQFTEPGTYHIYLVEGPRRGYIDLDIS